VHVEGLNLKVVTPNELVALSLVMIAGDVTVYGEGLSLKVVTRKVLRVVGQVMIAGIALVCGEGLSLQVVTPKGRVLVAWSVPASMLPTWNRI
jgi:hypothetical protein